MVSRNALLNIALALIICAVMTVTTIGVLAILEREKLPVSEIGVSQSVFIPIQNVQPSKNSTKPIHPITTPIQEPKINIVKSPSSFKVEQGSSSSKPQEQTIVTAKVLSTDQDRLQFLMDTVPQSASLPSDAAILISFFDKPNSYLLQGRTISSYAGQDYDLKIETGDYYLSDAVYDFCGTVNKIKSLQDYRWTLNKNKLDLLIKYAGAILQKNTCG